MERELMRQIKSVQRQIIEQKEHGRAPRAPEQAASSASEAAAGREKIPFRRVIVLSNRIPVNVSMDSITNSWRAEMALNRDLSMALSGLSKSLPVVFVGWTGPLHCSCVPLFLNERTARDYYDGFCSGALWPLLHYAGPGAHWGVPRFERAHWEAYQAVNRLAAEVAAKIYREGDCLWGPPLRLLSARCLR
eukprot:tig00000241_g20933.t1